MKKELRPYQIECAKEIYEKQRAIVADGMGLGKCAETIAAKTLIERRTGDNSRCLIVSPSTTMPHWMNQIREWYHRGKDSLISMITTENYDASLAHAKNADFTIISYPTLSRIGSDEREMGRLSELGFNYGILDEAQNAKNPEAIRSKAIKGLFDSMKYLAVSSGTIIPNSIVDLYMLLSLMDKEKFPINPENPKAMLSNFYNMFRQDPEMVRRILQEHLVNGHAREADMYLHTSMPRLNKSRLEVILDGEHREVYEQIYNNDSPKPGNKLMQLLKASIDPNLVNPKYLEAGPAGRIGKMESSVYKTLDEAVKKAIESGGKALIFSNLREGVTDKLRERYAKYGALVVDGKENDVSIREEARLKFQRDPNYRVLIATTVMDEGVDLTAATDIFHLTLPYTPAALDQRNSRSQRIGEVNKDEVNAHVICPKLSDGTPMITEGQLNLLDDKRRIINYVMKNPLLLSRKDLEEIANGHAQTSAHLKPLMLSPCEMIRKHLSSLKSSGADKIKTFYENNPSVAEYFARLYANRWMGNYGGNTANLYARAIKVMEEDNKFNDKLDIASGPFSLSRAIGEPVQNIDINRHMLEAGRMLENEGVIVPGNAYTVGSMHSLPFDKNSFDLAVNSLALHMLKPKEREQAFREINRVLRDSGRAIITLPYTLVDNTDLTKMYDGLRELGFDVSQFSGFYRGPAGTSYKGYMAGLRKIGNSTAAELPEDTFDWHMDREILRKRSGASKKRKGQFVEPKKQKMECVDAFFDSHTGKPLDESIRAGMK